MRAIRSIREAEKEGQTKASDHALIAQCGEVLLSCRVRRLIVNADDLGLTEGVNRGILAAHEQGIVTSSTLMAVGSAFYDAVRITSTAPRLGVGCHVVLTDGSALLSPTDIPTVANSSGEFERSFGRFVARALMGGIRPAELQAEATAQIRKLQSAGITVSHIDTHKHTHLFPRVLSPVLQAARACGIRAVRNPFGRIAFNLIANRPKLWKRFGQMSILNKLANRFQKTVRDSGLRTTDGSIGVVATGSMDEHLFGLVLRDLPEGTWELVTHPGHNDADLGQISTRLRESREQELRLLTAQSTRDLLDRNGIDLISYHDLA